MTTPLLQAKQLSKSYHLAGDHTIQALQNVDMELQQGSWLTITGPSGSGKSTLLALLAGLDRPSTGEVFLNGQNISQANDVRLAHYRKEKIGIIFQEYQLFEELTSMENVAMPLVVSCMTAKQRQEKAMNLLETVGLSHRAEHLPRQLSGGERQRVAVARALVRNPEIIFADEPTSNIDKQAADTVMELFHSFKNEGKSLIVVSHSERLAEAADTQICMESGRIVP
ncbi:MAG: macrolide ABC transporter ATP-binding protein [Desulfocapsa sp.]|nr:MAG: macrolide ABC transporter ATP-binding protein [Desulfocapsa sp.]